MDCVVPAVIQLGGHCPKLPPGPGLTVTHYTGDLTAGGPGKQGRTSCHQLEEFGKVKREGGEASPYILPTCQDLPPLESFWAKRGTCHQEGPRVRMTGLKAHGN